MEEISCRNCGASVTGNYCSECGQKRQKRISLRLLASDIYNAALDFESPFLKTMVTLTINPGKVYREYLDGAQKRYFSPVRYSLWILTLMVAVGSVLGLQVVEIPIPDDIQTMFEGDVEAKAELIKFLEDFEFLLNATLIPMTFITSLWLAICARLVFFNKQYRIAEWFIPFLLNGSHICLLIVLSMLIGVYEYDVTKILLATASVMYMTWGIAELFQPRSFINYLKSFAIAVVAQYLFYSIFMYSAGYIGGKLAAA